MIKMRGLPFKANDMEVREWFSSVADCQDVNIQYGSDGRPSGQVNGQLVLILVFILALMFAGRPHTCEGVIELVGLVIWTYLNVFVRPR